MKKILFRMQFQNTRFLERALEREFSPAAQKEMQKIAELEKNKKAQSEIYKRRAEVKGIAIDKKTTLDRDDAISVGNIEKQKGGRWKIEVHIADVSAIIKPGMALDKEANERGATQYLKNSNIPMIPHLISEKMLSLGGNFDRSPTITFEIPVSEKGDVGMPKVRKTYLKGNNKITYDEADQALKNKTHPNNEILENATKVIRVLRKKGGKPIEHISSHNIIHEFMVLTNKAMAKFCQEKKIPVLYRNQKGTEKAKYTTIPEGHAGFGGELYGHFTSPLRRNPDRLNNQNLIDFVENKKFSHGEESLNKKAEILNNGITAKKIQKETKQKINTILFSQKTKFPHKIVKKMAA